MINKKLYSLLAKSDGTTLVDHSKMVEDEILNVRGELFNNALIDENSPLTEKNLRLIGYFHDIGKVTKNFQRKLNGGVDKEKYNHNEIGYAFLKKYTNIDEFSLRAILYHHTTRGNYFRENNYSVSVYDVLESISEKDIELMIEFVKLKDPSLLLKTPNEFGAMPSFFSLPLNGGIVRIGEMLYALSYLFIADRCVSGYNSSVMGFIEKPTKDIKYTNTYNNIRSEKQEEISLINDSLFAINAPAGFGKTNTALMWGLKSNLRTMVVCPTNTITKNVYKKLTEEMTIGESNAKNALVLTNSVVENNSNETYNDDVYLDEILKAQDFVTINIDSFLKGIFEFGDIFRFVNVLHSDVVFDEYQDFIGEEAIFSFFMLLIRSRNLFSKAKTMLMSATPVTAMNKLLSDGEEKIVFYPKSGRYPMVHDKNYFVEIIDESQVKNNFGKNELVIYNTVSEIQDLAEKHKTDRVIHHKYTTKDRDNQYSLLMSDYSFGSESRMNKETDGFYGAIMARTSLNVSFMKLTESVVSHRETIQSIGRCNRFGDYDNGKLQFFWSNSKSENKLKSILYGSELPKKWFEFLRQELNGVDSITLIDLYDLYYKFEYDPTNQTLMKKHMNRLLDKSVQNLIHIHPTKSKRKTITNVKKSDSNKLRKKPDIGQFFIICDDENGNLISEPLTYSFNYDYDNWSDLFDGYGDFREVQKNHHDRVRELGLSSEYQYDEVLYDGKGKLVSDADIILSGRFSNTPLYLPSKTYSKKLGLLK